jgi:hypothetical protein
VIIRDSKNPSQWAALRRALRGRGPRFVVRESLPPATIAWSRARLPLVLVSRDVREQLAASFVRAVPDAPEMRAGIQGAGGR